MSFKSVVSGMGSDYSLYDLQTELYKYFMGNQDLSFHGKRNALVLVKKDALRKAVEEIRKNSVSLCSKAQHEYITFRFLPEVIKRLLEGGDVYGVSLNHSKLQNNPEFVAKFIHNCTYASLYSNCTELDLRLLFYQMEGEDLGPYMSKHEIVKNLIYSVGFWVG